MNEPKETKTVTITRPATNEEMILIELRKIRGILTFFQVLVILYIVLEVIGLILS